MEDIALSRADRAELLVTLAAAYNTPVSVTRVLSEIGYPPAHHPSPAISAEDSWRAVFDALDVGIVVDGYRSLLESATKRYSANPTFQKLSAKYLSPAAAAPDEGEPACHLLVRRHDDERAAVRALTAGGVDTQLLWSTETVSMFRLDTAESERVRGLLDPIESGWTLVPAGAPSYVLSSLLVQGPDGRQFRLTDVPAHQTVASVAHEVLGHYLGGGNEATRPTVVDRVIDDGAARRMNPEDSIHDAGLRDGDSLRVGFQATAGAIHPRFRDDALARARNQLTAYARAHPDVTVTPDSPSLATCYEVRFTAASLGPPPAEGAEPVDVERHVVQIRLGADYPVTAPSVFWLTGIFHPNVYPTYDCEASRSRPELRGLVCLGELAEAYQPSLDLGYLCQAVRDLAGYRNYDIIGFGPTANYFDARAAAWAVSHQERITALGGRPLRPDSSAPGRERFRPTVEGLPG